jgi:threonine aldolase
VLEKLGEKFAFSLWQKMGDGRSCVRFCVSWATTPEQIHALLDELKALMQ